MRMHVPQAGNDGLARDVDARHAGGDRHRRARPDTRRCVRRARRSTPSAIGGRPVASTIVASDERVGARTDRGHRPGDGLEIGDPRARRRADEADEAVLEIFAHRLEAQAAGPRDRRRQRTGVVHPQRFPAPHDAVDHVLAQPHVPRADLDLVGPALFDDDVVQRLAGNGEQMMRPAVRAPVAQEQHLGGERRVAVRDEEDGRERDRFLPAVGADGRLAAVDRHLGVHVHEAVGLALRRERDRRVVGRRPQRRGERHAAAAVGEFEVGREHARLAVTGDRVVFVADRLLDVMKAVGDVLDRFGRRGRGGRRDHRRDQQDGEKGDAHGGHDATPVALRRYLIEMPLFSTSSVVLGPPGRSRWGLPGSIA